MNNEFVNKLFRYKVFDLDNGEKIVCCLERKPYIDGYGVWWEWEWNIGIGGDNQVISREDAKIMLQRGRKNKNAF